MWAISASVIFFLMVIVSIDAVKGYHCLEGIRIEFPMVTRLSRGKEGQIELRIHQNGSTIQTLQIGIQFPNDIVSPHTIITVKLSSQTKISSIKWACTGLKHGQYFLNNCFIQSVTPWGFWARRTVIPIHTEIRVYPEVFSEKQLLAAIFRKKDIGIHAHRQIGKGRDFDQLREYLPGDNYDDIYWKSTAKRGYPVTKVYQIERSQSVYVVIDASRLSSRESFYSAKRLDNQTGQFSTLILDRFLTTALVIGLACGNQGDLFGVIAFSDTVRRFVKAGSGKSHYSACRDVLYTLQPSTATPDYSEVFTYIGTNIQRRSLMIFLANLDDPMLAENFIKHLPIICRRHMIIVAMIKPTRANPLFSYPNVHSVDEIYQCLGGHYLWSSLVETGKIMKKQGVHFALLENEKLCADVISKYVSIKQRQLL